jgi:hypothetical protein
MNLELLDLEEALWDDPDLHSLQIPARPDCDQAEEQDHE